MSGSVFLVHGEQHALSAFAQDVRQAGLAPDVIIPMLGETWMLIANRVAKRVGVAREDFQVRIAPRDWTARLAALESGLADRLRALPSDAARERVIASMTSLLENAESIRTIT